MTGTDCDLFTPKPSRSYLNHLVVIKNAICCIQIFIEMLLSSLQSELEDV
jgi:hypothetical protein